MIGIERLRTLARTSPSRTLGGALAEIADQIEREFDRHYELDSTDKGTRLLYVTDEDREALEWVRKYGGIGCVQTMAAKLGDTLNWIRERVGIGEDEVVDYDELLDAIDRRLMPEGCEWPTVDGRKVDFKTPYQPSLGVLEAVSIYSNGACEVMSHDGIIKPVSEIHVVVLVADGEPLEVGQTVWDTNGDELVVVALEDGGNTVTCRYADVGDGIPTHGMWSPSQLTHTKPEIDSWKRVEEDAKLGVNSYRERYGIKKHDGMTLPQLVREDLVRRCKELAERERGE